MLDLFGFGRHLVPASSGSYQHLTHPGWPEATPKVWLPNHRDVVGLRPLVRSDYQQWRNQRLADQTVLQRVEPTVPGSWRDAHSRGAWWRLLLQLRNAAVTGSVVPLAIVVNDEFAGQLTLGAINRGMSGDCWIGYWVHSGLTGQGVATAAVALGTDHAFTRSRIHRVTATYMPTNPASGRVLIKNGYREEGYLQRNLHINGRWEDHCLVALCEDDYSTSCVDRLVFLGFTPYSE